MDAVGNYADVLNSESHADVSEHKLICFDMAKIKKNPIQTAEALQAIGDGIQVVGLVTLQPEIFVVGEAVSDVGLGIEVASDFATKGVNTETAKDAGVKIGSNIAFGRLGDAGVAAARKVAGKESVESGANQVSESIIDGTTRVWEKITEFIMGEKKKQ